ncbi:hypothetical protein H6788_02090 [Candidatus Nomurabacteria bacterium]|nr:hypothetical protein [Candidatus Nomurabacteria bacterium]
MGTVHLTNGHHGLYISNDKIDLKQRVLLTQAMLERPIFIRGERWGSPMQDVIRGALQGLMDLKGFNAAVSYLTVEHDGVLHISTPKRVWCEISLETPWEIALGFSHDSRYRNHPFTTLLQWLEEEYPAGELPYNEFKQFCFGWVSPEKWREFFEHRIQKKVETMRSKANTLRHEAQGMTERANSIEAILG